MYSNILYTKYDVNVSPIKLQIVSGHKLLV